MHRLSRPTGPDCLRQYDYRTQCWEDIAAEHKSEVRSALSQMQGDICAYCEGRLDSESHIEHFRRKNPSHYPQLTFEWSNLFLSCGSRAHCGHFKDRRDAPRYNPDKVLKPDEHEVDQYLYFHSDGEVRARTPNTISHIEQASNTIAVLGLDNNALKKARQNAVKRYLGVYGDDLEELMTWPADKRQEYIQSELESVQKQPYSSAIRHFLTRQG